MKENYMKKSQQCIKNSLPIHASLTTLALKFTFIIKRKISITKMTMEMLLPPQYIDKILRISKQNIK